MLTTTLWGRYHSGKSKRNANALSHLPTGGDPPRDDNDWEEVEMAAFYSCFAQQNATTTMVDSKQCLQVSLSDPLQEKMENAPRRKSR